MDVKEYTLIPWDQVSAFDSQALINNLYYYVAQFTGSHGASRTLLLLCLGGGFVALLHDTVVLFDGVGQWLVAVDAGIAAVCCGNLQRSNILMLEAVLHKAEEVGPWSYIHPCAGVKHLAQLLCRLLVDDQRHLVFLVTILQAVNKLDGLLCCLTHLFLAEINK